MSDRPPPRRWASAPGARLAGVRGVLTDIDDTLTRHGAIEAEALAALHALQAAGLPVIAITGRPKGWSEPFAMAWPVAAIVAENGGVLLRREAGMLRVDYAQDEATRARHAARLREVAAQVLRQVPGATLARDSSGRATDIAIDHAEFAHLDAPAIEQVVSVMRAQGLHATVSSIHVNGWLGTHDKWSGARWAVRACLGEDLASDDWVVVGDSANDQVMFERIPLSVGVANIAPLLPQLAVPPAWVTEGERGQGFAEIAASLLRARGG